MRRLPLCCRCARLKDFKVEKYEKVVAHCEAYPDGIPEAVVYAGHRYPKPDDKELQFTPKNPEEHIRKVSQKEEDEEYKELQKYYEELDMTDEEWVEMKKKTTKLPEEEIRMFLDMRPRRETEPKTW